MLALFFEKSRFLKIPSVFQQNQSDEKSVGDFQSWESNDGQQWLSRSVQIKIWQGFCWEQNFDGYLREKIRPFCSHTKWLKKT